MDYSNRCAYLSTSTTHMKQTPHANRASIINGFIILSIAGSVVLGILQVRDQKRAEAEGTTSHFYVVK